MIANDKKPPKTMQPLERIQGERRKYLQPPLIVLNAKLDDERRKIFFGYAKNISRGGMFISSVNPQEPGSRFHIEFFLPKQFGKSVRCHCEVVWKRPFVRSSAYEPGMGLRFLDLPDECASAIEAWVLS